MIQPPPISAPGVPSVTIGDVITVSNTSGGTRARLAALGAPSRDRTGDHPLLDPSLAGATITRDSTLNVARHVTIEGPANRSITLSGGGSRRVMYIAEGTHLKNLTITGGYDQVVGGGRRASAVMATRRAKGRVHLENSIIVGNGTPVSNCWYPAETFVRLGLNIADDLTCGDITQMLIQDPRQPS